MATLLTAYIVSLVVRSPDDSWPWIDGWGVAAYEVILAALLLARGFSKLPGRAVPLTLGAAVMAWALGDVAITAEGWNGAKRRDPQSSPTRSTCASTPWPTRRSCSCSAVRSGGCCRRRGWTEPSRGWERRPSAPHSPSMPCSGPSAATRRRSGWRSTSSTRSVTCSSLPWWWAGRRCSPDVACPGCCLRPHAG